MNLITMAKRHQLYRLSSIQNFTKTACCGIREISGLAYFKREPETSMLSICFRMLQQVPREDEPFTPLLTPDLMKWRYFIYSQAGRRDRNKYGDQLTTFIETMGFGTVLRTPNGEVNPNSGNELIVFIWTINREALITWFNTALAQYNAWLATQKPVVVIEPPVIVRVNRHAAQPEQAAPPMERPPDPVAFAFNDAQLIDYIRRG